MENLNECIIGLGSNRDKEVNIEKASALLAEWFTTITFSPVIESQPVSPEKTIENYLNCTAIAQTDKSLTETNTFLKETEKKLGRQPSDKESGSIPIDLDLVKWNNTLLKEKEWHQPYFQRGLQAIRLR